jgi:hypothetical protein
MIGRFHATMASLDFLETVLAEAMVERGATDDGLRHAVMSYLRAVALHVPFTASMDAEERWLATHDIENWTRDRFARSLSTYAIAEPRLLHARVSDDTRALLKSRVSMFGEHPSGLGKFTRSMFARDLRRRMESLDSEKAS